jgi:Zn finger protein HypA/HybF involved in hydrogenase expression
MSDDLAAKVALKAFKTVGRAMGAGALTSVFDEHKGRDVVVPADLHLAKLPPVAADGTAECWLCQQRFRFAELDITGDVYACRACLLRQAQVAASQQADVGNVKIGRGRWWLMPSIVLAVGAIAAAGIVVWRGWSHDERCRSSAAAVPSRSLSTGFERLCIKDSWSSSAMECLSNGPMDLPACLNRELDESDYAHVTNVIDSRF